MKLPATPPNRVELSKFLSGPEAVSRILGVGSLVEGTYVHWDKLRFQQDKCPPGLSLPEWWLGIKLARERLLRHVPLLDKEGNPFGFATPDPILKKLHSIDQNSSGQIQMSEEVTNASTRDRYIISSLIKESITSSQLEGASTTTDVAKRMIRSGRQPTDRSEQMIYNNYLAMQFIRQNRSKKLSPRAVCELHRIVTDGTLDDSTKAGTFRSNADEIQVERKGTVVHVPPEAEEVPVRLDRMCRFANDRPADIFIHPVVRAVCLHFWVGYDHPFVDGNGRTARALFYWSMLSQGYWLAEYLSISQILKEAPAQYTRAYLLTETDGNDLTYFLDYQLDVICRAIKELQQYLTRKITEIQEVEARLKESGELNHRQLALLSHAVKHPGFRYTIDNHKNSHGVVYQTARTDLLDLVDRGLLESSKRGRTYIFFAAENLNKKMQA